jgi:hypothetical protein
MQGAAIGALIVIGLLITGWLLLDGSDRGDEE